MLIQPHPPAVAGPKPRQQWQWRCLGSPARGPSPRSGLQGDQVGLQGWATGEAGPGGGGGGGGVRNPKPGWAGLAPLEKRWPRPREAPFQGQGSDVPCEGCVRTHRPAEVAARSECGELAESPPGSRLLAPPPRRPCPSSHSPRFPPPPHSPRSLTHVPTRF